jgi:uncharacterized protein (DUF924 family)
MPLTSARETFDAARQVLDFWFGAPTQDGGYEHRSRWFRAEPTFDSECLARFGALCAMAAADELGGLQNSAEGSLALVLLLDQLPRNIHRGRPQAFAADGKARQVARRAIERGFDGKLSRLQRLFLYLPFEHSEDLADQDLAMRLIGSLGDEEQTYWARRHHDVIARFGRFPHRNAILGRENTAEEEAFLKNPGSSF